jgi:hypothetical protein
MFILVENKLSIGLEHSDIHIGWARAKEYDFHLLCIIFEIVIDGIMERFTKNFLRNFFPCFLAIPSGPYTLLDPRSNARGQRADFDARPLKKLIRYWAGLGLFFT